MEHDELVAIAKPVVWRRGYRAGLSTHDREDLLQDLRRSTCTRGRTGTHQRTSLPVETATSNAIVDRFRVAERRPADDFAEGGDDPVSLAVAAMRSTRFASAPAVSRKILLHNLFALIPSDDARLLRGRYLENDAAAELATRWGSRSRTSISAPPRAKRKLRDALVGRPDLVEELRAPHPHVY